MLQFNQSIKESYSIMKLLNIAGEQIHQLLHQNVTVFLVESKSSQIIFIWTSII